MSENEQKAGCVDAIVDAVMDRFFGKGGAAYAFGEPDPMDPVILFADVRQVLTEALPAALEAAALSPARSGEAVAGLVDATMDNLFGRGGAAYAYHPMDQVISLSEVRDALTRAIAPNESVDWEYRERSDDANEWSEWRDISKRTELELRRPRMRYEYRTIAPRNESSGVSPGGGDDSWKVGFYDRWHAYAQQIGYTGIADALANLALLKNTPAPQDSVRVGDGEWRIDTSAGSPILVYENCSVIQDEQAEYVLRLIEADRTTPAPAAGADGLSPAELRALTVLLMCSDPWPVIDLGEGDGMAELTALADREARRAGFSDWLDAFHDTRPLSDGAGQSAGGGR